LKENNTADPRMKNAMKAAMELLFSAGLSVRRDVGGPGPISKLGKVAQAMPRLLCQPLHTSSAPIAVRPPRKAMPSRAYSGTIPCSNSKAAPRRPQPERNKTRRPETILVIPEGRRWRDDDSTGTGTKNGYNRRRNTTVRVSDSAACNHERGPAAVAAILRITTSMAANKVTRTRYNLGNCRQRGNRRMAEQ